MADEHDFVVIGGGTAGCVLANRLSADPKASVALLEAGGEARHPFIHIPLMAGLVYFMRSITGATRPSPTPSRRAPHPMAARQGAGRHVRDQRHDVHARQPPGLRRLAPARPRRLGLRERAALLQAGGGPRLPPRRLSRQRRPRSASTAPPRKPALRRLSRGLRGDGPAAQRRFQRRGAGRRRPAGFLRRPGAPGSTRAMPSSCRYASGPTCAWCCAPTWRSCSSRAGAASASPGAGRAAARDSRTPRGDPLRRRDQLPPDAAALRRRRAGASALPRHRRGPGEPGRRPQPAGPRGRLRAECLHAAGRPLRACCGPTARRSPAWAPTCSAPAPAPRSRWRPVASHGAARGSMRPICKSPSSRASPLT